MGRTLRVVILRTERFWLRQLTMADVDNLFALDGDPEVMRYLRGEDSTRNHIEQVVLPSLLAEYDRSPGLGVWAAIGHGSDEFLGWMSLRTTKGHEPDDVELGYRLRRAVWGKGLATEGSRALIVYGFDVLGVARVWAETRAENRASQRVMAKAGLRFERTFPHHGDETGGVEYALTRAEYEEGYSAIG
jgi:RimJ/RimL family protein N-acetyltransferase